MSSKSITIKEEVEYPNLYLSMTMKQLSELEYELWEHKEYMDKVKMQKLISSIKDDIMKIDDYYNVVSVQGNVFKKE